MSESKKFFYDGDVIWDSDEEVNASTLANEIVNYDELSSLDEIIIGCWGESYDNSVQDILNAIVENKSKFQDISRLFVGDMDFEECEVSWIEQGDYTELIKALPNLKSLTIKGSNDLSLGDNFKHDKLEELEIICGGLPASVLNQITNAKLPSLKKLNLYLGVEDYGGDTKVKDITKLFNAEFIKQLEYLGVCDSEMQDEVVGEFVKLPVLSNIQTLDFSKGTLSDEGGEVILSNIDKFKHIKTVDLTYHYLSDDMMKKLSQTGVNFLLDEQQGPDEYDGEIYTYPMLTE